MSKIKQVTLPSDSATVKITEKQWNENISNTFEDVRGELVTTGEWQIPVKYRALAVRKNWKSNKYGDYIETVTLYGKRTLGDIKEDGYKLTGRVSINGKKIRAYTSSVLFELPDGRLYEVAVISC